MRASIVLLRDKRAYICPVMPALPAFSMAKTTLTREVSGCDSCPFARKRPGANAYCFLDPKLDISPHAVARNLLDTLNGVGPYPAGCPLTQRICTVRLKGFVGGRPRQQHTPGRDLDKEAAHLLAWVKKKFPGGWPEPATWYSDQHFSGRYGPPLDKIHHLRKAMQGLRPFWEIELDKLVAHLTEVYKYPGYAPPGFTDADNPLTKL